jgi:hypothetical protein
MSEIVSAGENELLVFFQEYLNRRATGKEPPITIKAKDLDKNYKLATVINNPDESDEDRSYSVEYREEGTVLNIITLPDGATKGDLLYWDPAQGDNGAWVILPAPSGTSLRVLGFNGSLLWVNTEDC